MNNPVKIATGTENIFRPIDAGIPVREGYFYNQMACEAVVCGPGILFVNGCGVVHKLSLSLLLYFLLLITNYSVHPICI